jgi:hypothetical protein
MAKEQFRLLTAVREQQISLSEISTQFSRELGNALSYIFQKYCQPTKSNNNNNGGWSIRGSSTPRTGLQTLDEDEDRTLRFSSASIKDDQDNDYGSERGESVSISRDSISSFENRTKGGMMPRTVSKGLKMKVGGVFGAGARRVTKLPPLPPRAAQLRLQKAHNSLQQSLLDFDPLFESLF